jgi:hypothetical protein
VKQPAKPAIQTTIVILSEVASLLGFNYRRRCILRGIGVYFSLGYCRENPYHEHAIKDEQLSWYLSKKEYYLVGHPMSNDLAALKALGFDFQENLIISKLDTYLLARDF